MQSIWSKTAELPPHPPLPGDLKVEAAVIGGGMAGILTACLLQEKGVESVVLEAERIGGGQTKNTTAKITSQHGLIYAALTEKFGQELAGQYARVSQRAVEEYCRLTEDWGAACQLERCPAYLYSTQSEDALLEEAHAAQSLGLPAEFTLETELPFPIKGAVRFDGQARFHPLRFLEEAAKRVTVYEQTRALEVQGDEIRTDRGTVRAKHIVFATHFPFVNFPGYYFLRMHQERSYVLALENALLPQGLYYGVDPDGLSLRQAEHCLLLGGGGHRTGENSAGGRYRLLRREAERYWPQSREVAHWSAQDCMPMDSVPYIGRYASDREGWYVATGFRKWGMTGSMAAAMLLSDQIAGREHPDRAVFSPQRFDLPASAKSLMADGKQTVKGLSRQLFAKGRALAEELPAGHGGVVELDGEKVGAYRTESGELFLVSTRCPHLGCQLEWNPDEKSWDCPCHGSRFDYRGELLSGPAQIPLERN